MNEYKKKLEVASHLIVNAEHLTAFTGAGISVESGIPPFRGEEGLWSKYDPSHFEIYYFKSHPEETWRTIIKIFYDTFEKAQPNEAHFVLSRLEMKGILKAIITQNIDNLHNRAGSRNVIEYHGNSRNLVCLECNKYYEVNRDILQKIPLKCRCGGLLKPDFVFFGEPIPEKVLLGVFRETEETDVMLVIGTTGEIFPASAIPIEAKKRDAKIIEINVDPSSYTDDITDIFLQGKASVILKEIENCINRANFEFKK